VRGATYTYLQITNVDVAFVFVYATNGALVAELLWSASRAAMGLAWTCAAGPDNFNANEAISLLPVTADDLGGMCP
jgi:hypothetical protein